MNTSMSESDRRCILAFVAAFLWADFAPDARRLTAAARELGFAPEDAAIRRYLRMPPHAAEVDPSRLTSRAHGAALVLCKRVVQGRPSLAGYELLTLLEEMAPQRTTQRTTQRTSRTAEADSPVAA